MDTVSVIGIQLKDEGELVNAQFCQIVKGEKIIKYTPYEIREYGFKDGRVYISYDVIVNETKKKVFLEQVVKGNISLYYYKGKTRKIFFIEKRKGELVKLIKRIGENGINDFHDQLRVVTNNYDLAADATYLVKYNKKSLTKFIEGFNKEDLQLYPFFRYGVLVGYSGSKLFVPSYMSKERMSRFNFIYESSFTFGMFIDKPLISYFSLHMELYYNQFRYSYYSGKDDIDTDFLGNTSSLSMPILLRYTFPNKKIRPFLNIGGSIKYNLKNESILYEAMINQSIIEIEDVSKEKYISNLQLGFSLGGGLEYKIGRKNSLFFDIRYSYLFGLSKNKTLEISEVNFTTGINF